MASSLPPGEGDGWFFAGLASSFPNITDASERYFKLAWPQPCGPPSPSHAVTKVPGCKVFHPQHTGVNAGTPATAAEVDIDAAVGEDAWLMREQVLVFQYKGAFHAVDHACPHRAYSLSWGQPLDIEDAGRVVGQGIRCRGHSYAFELSTGIGDRGEYRLGVWDVELRLCRDSSVGEGAEGPVEPERENGKEVWVRRRRRDTKAES
ncbi:unnamed protein product [Discula destructiva]